jgi:hypothetical protein
MLLPRPAERSVEHLLDRTQGDPIVLGTEQEVEPGERSIEKLGLGSNEVSELRAVELLPQLFAFADLPCTDVATSGAILTRECVGCGAVFEQARLPVARWPAGWSERSLRAGLHAPHRRRALDDAVGSYCLPLQGSRMEPLRASEKVILTLVPSPSLISSPDRSDTRTTVTHIDKFCD